MILTLVRRWRTAQSTIGDLYVDHVWECYTLEDPVRPDPDPSTHENEAKIPGSTAIPDGRYRVLLTPSPRFGRVLPELLAVPGFTNIRIHAGNRAEDTAGCLLVGRARGPDVVGQSQPALAALGQKIAEGLRAGEVWIEITTGTEEEDG